jgi:drug/metabolite transporter superfamily protein YnfA
MKLPGWITSMLSVALIERAMIQYSRKWIKPKIGVFFSKLNIVELLAFLILSLVTLNFQFVLIHAAYGMAFIVAGFAGFVHYKEKSTGSKQMLYGVLLSAIGALFFVFKIGLDKWFNHVDISHVFMMIASVVYYKGARRLIVA